MLITLLKSSPVPRPAPSFFILFFYCKRSWAKGLRNYRLLKCVIWPD